MVVDQVVYFSIAKFEKIFPKLEKDIKTYSGNQT